MSEPKQIAAVYHFPSDSNPDRPPYETLLYSDRSLTCNCPGWTFKARRLANGQRTCKHTRLVQAAVHVPSMSGIQPSITYPCFAALITTELSTQLYRSFQPTHNQEEDSFEETKRKRHFNL